MVARALHAYLAGRDSYVDLATRPYNSTAPPGMRAQEETMRWWRLATHPAVIRAGGLWALFRQARLAFRLPRDERVPTMAKLVVPAALLYLASPLDIVVGRHRLVRHVGPPLPETPSRVCLPQGLPDSSQCTQC